MGPSSTPALERTDSHSTRELTFGALDGARALCGRHQLLVWICSVLVFNLLWYGVYLAFPLIDEDAAANYSSLLEAIRYSDWSIFSFPIKWLEGLGQPNVFEPLAFDPFAWLMLIWPASADALRVSYALRASACWLTTYLFVVSLFHGARGLAVATAWLSLLINFTFANTSGSPTFAGITVATQAALFPGLLALYLRVVAARRLLNLETVAFACVIVVFLLSYPLQSALGLAVFLVFAGSHALLACAPNRHAAWLGLAKAAGLSSLALFAPWVGIYWTWSALGATSARVVFADELTTYPRVYQSPYFWHDVPVFLRALVLIALGLVLFHRTPARLRSVALTLAAVVGFTQLETIGRNLGAFNGFLERLPRPFYAEFYLPPFYAMIAAYVLCRNARSLAGYPVHDSRPSRVAHEIVTVARRILALSEYWSHRTRRGLGLLIGAIGTVVVFLILGGYDPGRPVLVRIAPNGTYAAGVLAAAAVVIVLGAWGTLEVIGFALKRILAGARLSPSALCALGMRVTVVVALARVVSERWDLALAAGAILVAVPLLSRQADSAPGRALQRFQPATPFVGVCVLFLGAWATWQYAPEEIHPIFASELTCRDRAPWCQDPAGRTMGAAASPITDHLVQSLPLDGVFRGRADYWLTPGLKLSTFPLDPDSPLSQDEFQMLNRWYASSIEDENPAAPVRQFTFEERGDLITALQTRAPAGLLTQDSVLEIVNWIHAQRPERNDWINLADWKGDSELEALVRERVRNYRATGNTMLQRALPFQGIQVASSYEQSLDYLYYLLWTRYLNEGFPASRSINMTEIEVAHALRLALVGVRFLVSREVPMRPANSDLIPVWNWDGYKILEVPYANTSGYAVAGTEFGADLEEELDLMRSTDFDPRRTAVLPESERATVERGPPLSSSLESPVITFAGQSLHFSAKVTGRSLVVLPYKYSNCWVATWSGNPGRVVRADVGLLGVIFDADVDLTLRWTAGYASGTDCLRQDARLVPQAQFAAERLK
jgi:hypothetical protein